MINLLFFTLSLFSMGLSFGMEMPRDPVTFVNAKGETVALSQDLISKIPALQTACVSNHLESSIGTHGLVELKTPELQNFTLIKACLDYENQTSDEIKEAVTPQVKDNLSHLVKTIEVAQKLKMVKVAESIGQAIGDHFQAAPARCEAFKMGQLVGLSNQPHVLNLIAQAIVRPSDAQYHVWNQAKQKNDQNLWALEQQLFKHMTPQGALVLLDAYEAKLHNTCVSYAPGAEKALPIALQPFAKLNTQQVLAHTWKTTKPSTKWTLAGIGATCVAAAGYGLWNWYSSQ